MPDSRRRNLFFFGAAADTERRLAKGEAKGMFREFIDEKWPELLVVLGVGMSCMALVVPLL
jgi:hypothetical protein